jgi:hypothetical protein
MLAALSAPEYEWWAAMPGVCVLERSIHTLRSQRMRERMGVASNCTDPRHMGSVLHDCDLSVTAPLSTLTRRVSSLDSQEGGCQRTMHCICTHMLGYGCLSVETTCSCLIGSSAKLIRSRREAGACAAYGTTRGLPCDVTSVVACDTHRLRLRRGACYERLQGPCERVRSLATPPRAMDAGD